MWHKSYKFFNTVLVCDAYQTGTVFLKEQKIYDYISRATHYNYNRIETSGQDGFPDILLLGVNDYTLIEAKIARKVHLDSIEDDLKWQFGQLGRFKKALTRHQNYRVVVGARNMLLDIKGEYNDSKLIDYIQSLRFV